MTERRNQTNNDTRQPALTPQQMSAVDLLSCGRTITDTAEAIGVSRQTTSTWLNENCEFQAELGRRRRELWNGASDRLRAMLTKALDVVEQELQGDSLKAALGVLRAAGLHGIGAPSGPSTAEDAALDAKERDAARTRRNFDAMLSRV